MTLNFMKQFPDGAPTYFREKIRYGINIFVNLEDCLLVFPTELTDEYYPPIEPKIHTFRRGNRWKAGIPIDFKQWSGLPYKSKTITFAPRIPCTGQQKIFIQSPSLSTKSRIFIDGKPLADEKINQLAINDGFNDEKHLFNYFTDHFEGQIVHWTQTRY